MQYRFKYKLNENFMGAYTITVPVILQLKELFTDYDNGEENHNYK